MSETTWVRRTPEGRNLVMFAHGYHGSATDTWKDFPALITDDPELSHYDCCFWAYATEGDPLNFVKRLVWSDNPDLDTLGRAMLTQLDETASKYEKLVLAAHSMGGLVVQLFLLGELQKNRRNHLDRISEVVLYGTPSAGLVKASLISLLDTQAADMSWFGSLIRDLRYHWQVLVDDKRAVSPPPFRLTLVAGMQDKFVPQEASLDPFPFDEKRIVPGNHIGMVKPQSRDDVAYILLKNRMLRGNPTVAERQMVMGQSRPVIEGINRVNTAAELGDPAELVDYAQELLAAPAQMPLVERALGLALLDYEVYAQSTELLTRYVNFTLPDSSEPFRGDSQAHQQLAIARSGTGDIAGSINSLKNLDPNLWNEPETLGIMAGRFKRQWLKTRTNPQVARKALELYLAALSFAQQKSDADQQYYNGVNAAYLQFALNDPAYMDLAEQTMRVATSVKPDYWSAATIAECHLLRNRYREAEVAYRTAEVYAHAPRHWSSTGQQALDILAREGNPPEGEPIRKLFSAIRHDFTTAGAP